MFVAKTLVAVPRRRPKWEREEKRLVVVSLLATALFLGGALWWARLNRPLEINIPTPALPAKNAYDLFLQATWSMPPVPRQGVDPLQDYDASAVKPAERAKRYSIARKRAWLAQNATALQLFRQGLKLPYQEPALRSYYVPLPHLARFRQLARTVTIESKVRAQEGNWQGAADSALDIMHFGHQTPHGGTLICAYVGLAIQSTGRRQMQGIVPHLNAAQCRSAVRRLEKMRALQVPCWKAFQEEKWMGQASLLQIMKQPDWAQQMVQISTGNRNSPLNRWRLYFYSKRTVLENYTNHLDAQIAAAKQPYATAPAIPAPTDEIEKLFVMEMDRSRFNFARGETGNALLVVALALRAYRLEHGTYPQKLDTLAPDYLQTLPIDGFGAGEPLHYKKQGDNYLLWSIGPDKKDNGGKAIQGRPVPNYYDDETTIIEPDSQGDWAWGKNR